MVINSSVAKAKNYYTYSASGVKLKTEQRYDHDLQQIPLQNTNPSNDGLKDYKITDYVGNIIYETEKTGTTAATNKTRILIDGGYIENGVYYFYLTDHLGNNRVVAKADGTVIQKNHYYPFGMTFAESTNEKAQPYKYNGKELDQMHGLNWYDSDARPYDAVIPRTPTPDPHAENYYAWSPYHYAGNNPILNIDPDGRDYWSTNDPEEIRRFLSAAKNGTGPNGTETFEYAGWEHATDAEFTKNLTYNDKTQTFYSSYNTIENKEVVSHGISVKAIDLSSIPENGATAFFGVNPNKLARGNLDGLGINSPEFIALTAWRAGGTAVAELARGVFNLMRSSTGTEMTVDASKSGFAAGRKGERGRTAKASGTNNPFKKLKPDPKNPNKVITKDADGKTKIIPKPAGFDDYWNTK